MGCRSQRSARKKPSETKGRKGGSPNRDQWKGCNEGGERRGGQPQTVGGMAAIVAVVVVVVVVVGGGGGSN